MLYCSVLVPVLTQCFHITNTHGRHQHYSYGRATTPTSASTTALKAEVDNTAKKSQYLLATLEKGLKFHRDKKTEQAIAEYEAFISKVKELKEERKKKGIASGDGAPTHQSR